MCFLPLQEDFYSISPTMRPPPEFQSDLRLWAQALVSPPSNTPGDAHHEHSR